MIGRTDNRTSAAAHVSQHNTSGSAAALNQVTTTVASNALSSGSQIAASTTVTSITTPITNAKNQQALVNHFLSQELNKARFQPEVFDQIEEGYARELLGSWFGQTHLGRQILNKIYTLAKDSPFKNKAVIYALLIHPGISSRYEEFFKFLNEKPICQNISASNLIRKFSEHLGKIQLIRVIPVKDAVLASELNRQPDYCNSEQYLKKYEYNLNELFNYRKQSDDSGMMFHMVSMEKTYHDWKGGRPDTGIRSIFMPATKHVEIGVFCVANFGSSYGTEDQYYEYTFEIPLIDTAPVHEGAFYLEGFNKDIIYEHKKTGWKLIIPRDEQFRQELLVIGSVQPEEITSTRHIPSNFAQDCKDNIVMRTVENLNGEVENLNPKIENPNPELNFRDYLPNILRDCVIL